MKETAFGLGAKLYELENQNKMRVKVSDYGATLVSLLVPDKQGELKDVVLGYENAEGYRDGTVFLGAVVGRNANRLGGASFTIGEKVYSLEKNDHENNLHSGPDYYSKRMWDVKRTDNQSITFGLHSPDKDQGYPGNADIEVTYTLTDENTLEIYYYAKADQDTVWNMTNHSYFNLNGHYAGAIGGHCVKIEADAYTRADEESIPTGEIMDTAGTPMDFGEMKAIGRDIEVDYEALNLGGGYDHNYVLKKGGTFGKAAEAVGDISQIKMEVYTDLPGMQFYTGNFIEEENGKENALYKRRSGVCFETQYFPDAVNKLQFESPVVKAGESYQTKTVFRFGIES